MDDICGIILAAGESSRMGRNKMLLPYGDKLIITSVIDKARESGIKNIILVLGAFRDDISKTVSDEDINIVFNNDYREGMLSSVQCGFRNLPGNCRAAMIFLGDQPMVPAEVCPKIISEYKKTGTGIVMPAYNNKRGHPVLIDIKYRNDIFKLNPDIGLRELMALHPDDIKEIDIKNQDILKDIDTLNDYLEAIN